MITKYGDFDAVLLKIWREVASHLRLEDALAAILPQLQAAFGVRGLLVRRLDTVRHRVEARAGAGMSADLAPGEGQLGEAPWSALLQWCGTATPLADEAPRVAKRLPGLLPRNLRGRVWVGCMELAGQPRGLLILDVTDCPDAAVLSACFPALLEPFTAALENDRHLHELSVLRAAAEADRQSLLTRLKRQDVTDTPIGAESGLREVMQRVDLVARSDTPVLILGETGSGKEVVARAVHRHSPRSSGPFLRVNCGAIPPELIDSELFGHERGSFTGAVATRQGWFERADGGTLFLDEIGELSPAAQVRLLRVLQDGSVQRVGGQHTLVVDVRVVAATHRDLHAMVTQGSFRQDLWYRIAIFPIHLPALRERTQDIPALATHFALQAAQRLGLAPQVPRPEDMALLVDYPWPGNVRELAAVMERAAILGDGRRLEVAQALGVGKGPLFTNPALSAISAEPVAVDSLDEHNRRHIEAVLASCAGRVDGPFGAARRLGINPNTLRGRMRKLGIDPRRFRQRL